MRSFQRNKQPYAPSALYALHAKPAGNIDLLVYFLFSEKRRSEEIIRGYGKKGIICFTAHETSVIIGNGREYNVLTDFLSG